MNQLQKISLYPSRILAHNIKSRIHADAIVDEARSCEDIFSERPPPRKRKSPFTAVNDVVKKLVMIASGIVESLG